jgi:prophage regulatory protein
MEPQKSEVNTAFLRLPAVLQVIPVSRSKWWAGVATGEYLKPVKLSERCTAWRRCDIDALIDRLSSGGKP